MEQAAANDENVLKALATVGELTDEDADLAYGPTDPKHPGFLNRVGA